MKNKHSDIQLGNSIGLIPAAGKASRLSPLPFSKELYPVGLFQPSGAQDLCPRPVCMNLLEHMRDAGVLKAYIILRRGKWDIPSYLHSGAATGMDLAYLVTEDSHSVPYTLDQAYPFVKDATVIFGFPDILFSAGNAYAALLEKHNRTGADVVLGLFPVSTADSGWDMVDFNAAGRISNITIKPAASRSRFTWIIALWTPLFTEFLHEQVRNKDLDTITGSGHETSELFISSVIQKAIDHGLKVAGKAFSHGSCVDIGTAEGLKKALQSALEEKNSEQP